MINKKALLFSLLHFLLVIIAYVVLFSVGIVNKVPNNMNLLHWDAEWFDSIRLNGYMFVYGQMNNLAFFPLFPYFWKYTALDPMGISVVNGVLFTISFAILMSRTIVPTGMYFFILSIASFIFFALPYSESLFFLFSVFILVGYDKENNYLKIIGFLGASLVRSASMIFVIAILICAIIPDNKDSKRRDSYIYNLISSFLGVLVVSFIQYSQTGKWFYFIDVQKFWGRSWSLPQFPLTTTFPERTLNIDGIAFTVGLIAIFYTIKWFFDFICSFKKLGSGNFTVNKSVAFSALFISGVTILDVCFTFKLNNASNIWSINRHILCTPFAIVFLGWLYNYSIKNRAELYFLFFSILSGIYLTGLYQYPNHALHYVVFFSSFLLLKYYYSLSIYLIPIYIFNIIIQILFYEDFIKNLWIG